VSDKTYKRGADDKNVYAEVKPKHTPQDGTLETSNYDPTGIEPKPHVARDGMLIDPNNDAPEFHIKEQRPGAGLHGGSGKHLPPQKGDDLAELKDKGYVPRGVEDNQASNMVPRAHPKPPKA
jgi:hypothetical protein